MTNILLVISSPRGEDSYSTRVARALAQRLHSGIPGAALTIRDLAREPLPHIGEAFVAGIATPAEERSPVQRAEVGRSDAVVDEVLAADIVIIASAMINFGIPSTLKAWIDHLARAGRTFRYTESGAEGLAGGKKVYLVEARGGIYSEGAMQAYNFQESYLRTVLGFLGLDDVDIIAVEGVAFGAEAAGRALAGALERVKTLAPRAA
ncbi:MAG TPA: FMN-dependent NADH-azoreductase [Mariprofundaceae bacterium]|nr:FMN-dependent NADH-azoreductase [Mariprofundaceae bacterium]